MSNSLICIENKVIALRKILCYKSKMYNYCLNSIELDSMVTSILLLKLYNCYHLVVKIANK